MKVGIITFQRADNYGSLLQCYALYKSVESFGVDVEVVDYRNPYIERAYVGLPNFRKNFIIWGKQAYTRFSNYSNVLKKHAAFEKLIGSMHFSEGLKKKDILHNGLDYDLIFTGSDQIWNPVMTNGFDDVYYLNFPGNFFRCSYAASLGNSKSKKLDPQKLKTRIDRMDRISVREQSACETIYALTGKNAQVCVDPTLLLSGKEWEALCEKADIDTEERYILLYYLDDNKDLVKIAQSLAKKHSAKIICCNKNPVSGENIQWIGDLGPVDFVKLVKDAAAVVASSFHAAVFSVIFGKALYAIPHPETGERVKTLAALCGFSDGFYKSFEDFESRNGASSPVSYDYTNLQKAVAESKDFINNAVETAKRRNQVPER